MSSIGIGYEAAYAYAGRTSGAVSPTQLRSASLIGASEVVHRKNLELHRLHCDLGATYRLSHAAELNPRVCMDTYRKQEHAGYADHKP